MEPLLASNLVDLARQYTKWAHEVRALEELALVLQRAFKEAMAPPQGPVFADPVGVHDAQHRPRGSRAGRHLIAPRFTGDLRRRSARRRRSSARPSASIIIAGDAVMARG